MLAVTSIRPKQLNRTEASFRFIRVFPDDPGKIRITITAYGPFAVSLFDRARAVLTVSVDGSDVQVGGTIREIKSKHARGTVYAYAFRADRPEALHAIRFHGLNAFSNVRSVTFELHGRVRRASNPFFRLPS